MKFDIWISRIIICNSKVIFQSKNCYFLMKIDISLLKILIWISKLIFQILKILFQFENSYLKSSLFSYSKRDISISKLIFEFLKSWLLKMFIWIWKLKSFIWIWNLIFPFWIFFKIEIWSNFHIWITILGFKMTISISK